MIWESIKLAIQSIWSAKFRAILTMLGIIIGISSVIMFMALGEGLRQSVSSEITALGSNLVSIFPGEFDPSSGNVSTNTISGDILKIDDVGELAALDGVHAATPYMIAGGTLRRNDKTAPTATIFGTYDNITETLATIDVDAGRMFTPEENDAKARVIVLGPGVKKTLFGDDNALDQTVQIGKESFRVVGLTKSPSSTGLLGGSDYAQLAMIPIQTAGDIAGGVRVMRIVVTLNDDTDPKAYISTINAALEKRHAPEDFSVLTQDDLLSTVDTILQLLTAAVSAIAAISLVVAGVGIMNIMLVSVTERTKEIGLRKAVGATTGAILWQFLTESIVLSVLGALIAVAFTMVASNLIGRYAPIQPVVTAPAVGLAVSVGIVVGLVFGLAPALRAARMDPIRALRYE